MQLHHFRQAPQRAADGVNAVAGADAAPTVPPAAKPRRRPPLPLSPAPASLFARMPVRCPLVQMPHRFRMESSPVRPRCGTAGALPRQRRPRSATVQPRAVPRPLYRVAHF
jgi:hypothetical protein